MHLDTNQDNSTAGTIITIILGLITFSDVEIGVKILAAVSATAASVVTIYFTLKNNRKK
jgi:cell division protein FtsW (lipid II flippase)